MNEFQDRRTIQKIVLNAHTVAIVGLSASELRASHFVGYYLQRHGYRVIPVNPNEEGVLGERAYPTLADVPERIDVVDVLEPHREAHRAGRDAGRDQLVVRELAMRRRGGMDDEALRVADVGEVAPERQRLDEAATALAAALEVEREDGARAGG